MQGSERAHLGADALNGIDEHESSVAQPRRSGHLARKVDVAGRVDEVDAELLEDGVAACKDASGSATAAHRLHNVAHRR